VNRAFGASCERLKPEKIPALARRPQHHHRRQRRRPQRCGVEQIAAALQAGEERLPRPERRQQRRDRRLQRREKVRQVRQRLDLQQLLGPDEAQHDDQARREQQPHQHQDVARPLGRKGVDQHQRRRGAGGHGDDRERHHRQERGDVEHHARAFCAADADQHRHHEDHDHPRRLHHGPQEAGVKQPAGGDRRHQQQPQIVRQEERRQRGHHAAEGEKREERQEQPGQSHPQQKVAELGVVCKMAGQPERTLEQRHAHGDPDAAEQQAAREIAALAPASAVARRQQVRQQEVRIGLDHQTISSSSCSPLPPVSFRNTEVS